MSLNLNHHDVEGDLAHRYNADASLWYYLQTLERFPSDDPVVDNEILEFVKHPVMQNIMYRKASLKLKLLRQNAARPECQVYLGVDYAIVDEDSLVVCGVGGRCTAKTVLSRKVLLRRHSDTNGSNRSDDSDASIRSDGSGGSGCSILSNNSEVESVSQGEDVMTDDCGVDIGKWFTLKCDSEIAELYQSYGLPCGDGSEAERLFSVDGVFPGNWRNRGRLLFVGDYISCNPSVGDKEDTQQAEI
jgi:hypothetical protein